MSRFLRRPISYFLFCCGLVSANAYLSLVKFMSAGICITIFLVLIIALPLTVFFFHRCYKKYGNYVCTGMAFILVGLCTFNFARFSHQLYVDPLSENPEVFLYRIKMSTTVAVSLIICAAFSFWLHKKKIGPSPQARLTKD